MDSPDLRFSRWMFAKIRGALTGEAYPVLLGEHPRDALHAGVLLPQQAELPGIESESTDQKPDSSLGMDFLVSVEAGVGAEFAVTPRISVYYAVYPTYDEAMSAYGVGTSNQVEDELDGGEEAEAEPDLSIARIVAVDFDAGTDREPDRLMLPLKYRRRDILLDPIQVLIPPDGRVSRLEYRDEFADALMNARHDMLADPSLWYHIGSPSAGNREISGVRDQSEYERALGEGHSGGAALPNWQALLTVSATPSLLEGERGRRTLRISVTLTNATVAIPHEERKRAELEDGALYNCSFEVSLARGQFVPFEFMGTPGDYRYDRTIPGVGSNCTVANSGTRLCTETVPRFEQPYYRTRSVSEVETDFLRLAGGTGDLLNALRRMTAAMEQHARQWNEFLEGPVSLSASEIEASHDDLRAYRNEIGNFELGVRALDNDALLARAFSLMNQTFARLGARRAQKMNSWRMFQLGFIVTQLPALAAREIGGTQDNGYSEGVAAALERLDVLWFPTGGGKTEAYLGLIATALFYDRLRGKDRGVTAWMRFPLRMLSLQQLDRLAELVAVAETVRSEVGASLKGSPFSIGYYVGGSNTPNRLNPRDVSEKTAEDWQDMRILTKCPFCGGGVSAAFDEKAWRLIHRCDSPGCFSNTSNSLGPLKGSLPVLVVDDEIYRYRPSVLVGTVDKLAVLGFQKLFSHLISSTNMNCPRHGHVSFDSCTVPGCDVKARDFTRLNPEKDPIPSLLIQDELHLLKEELGTFNAHYEGFLDRHARKLGYRPPKVLAATATIENYENQAFHLYLKTANRFPVPSWQDGESFFATSTPREHRRIYAGVLTHHRNAEDATLKMLSVYHEAVQWMRAHPSQGMAELGLAEEMSEKDFLAFLRLHDLSLVYVNRKSTGGNIAYRLDEVVSPRLGKPLSTQLLTGDNSMADVREVIEQVERERDVEGAEPAGKPRLDAIIATSLISHGVDLERLNFMSVVGMPPRMAEYIQASSRAARSYAGLVFVSFRRQRIRERSLYHYFLPNHRHLDRLVEPVPINRFSTFATRRTIPGLLSGLLLNFYSQRLYSIGKIKKPLMDIRTLQEAINQGVISETEVLNDIGAIVGVDDRRISAAQREYLVRSVREAFEENWMQIQRSLDKNLTDTLQPMLSFRDIDEAIDFVAEGPASMFVEGIN